MKDVFIEKHQAKFRIKAMCRVLKVSPSGWYAWRTRRAQLSPRTHFRQRCDERVSQVFHQAQQRYGAPRITDELREQREKYNTKRWLPA